MAHVADHLSVSALEQQSRSCTDVTAARHLQTIWLLAKGHGIAEVAATVSYARRWGERLLARYNAQGPQALLLQPGFARCSACGGGGAVPCRAGAKPSTGLKSWRRLLGGLPRGLGARSRVDAP